MNEEAKIVRSVALSYARNFGGELCDYEQEAWCAVLSARQSFDSKRGTRWGVYAWRAAVRALYGYASRMRAPVSGPLYAIRRLNATRSVEWNGQGPSVAENVAVPETPEAICMADEQRDRARSTVRRAIESDPEGGLARPVLFGEATLREAAERCGVSASRVHRATQRIRAAIASEAGSERR